MADTMALRPFRKVSKRVLFTLSTLALVALLLTGCSSPVVSLDFGCASRINDGLALTIDLVRIDSYEKRQIDELREDWFYSDLRSQLEYRTKTITVVGGCSRAATVTLDKNFEILAVIADYQFENRNRSRGQVQYVMKEQRRGNRPVRVQVGNTHLTIDYP